MKQKKITNTLADGVVPSHLAYGNTTDGKFDSKKIDWRTGKPYPESKAGELFVSPAQHEKADIGTTTTSIGPEGEIEYSHTVTPREQVLDAMIKEWLLEKEPQMKEEHPTWAKEQPIQPLREAFEAIMGRKAGS